MNLKAQIQNHRSPGYSEAKQLDEAKGKIRSKIARVFRRDAMRQAGKETFLLGGNFQTGEKWILCLVCHSKSWNPQDIENKYCGLCKVFHEP
ncbi:MAG TPA: hypothetical protein VG028_13370 [Terriglobia bacterium]|nr:hypothetical protein [Terriglobia bacterium]